MRHEPARTRPRHNTLLHRVARAPMHWVRRKRAYLVWLAIVLVGLGNAAVPAWRFADQRWQIEHRLRVQALEQSLATYRRGRELEASGNLPAAREIYQQLSADLANSQLRETPGRLRVDVAFRLGTVALLLGDPNAALQQSESIAQLDPRDYRAHSLRAQALEDNGETRAAIGAYEFALQEHENQAALAERLAELYARTGRGSAIPPLAAALERAVYDAQGFIGIAPTTQQLSLAHEHGFPIVADGEPRTYRIFPNDVAEWTSLQEEHIGALMLIPIDEPGMDVRVHKVAIHRPRNPFVTREPMLEDEDLSTWLPSRPGITIPNWTTTSISLEVLEEWISVLWGGPNPFISLREPERYAPRSRDGIIALGSWPPLKAWGEIEVTISAKRALGPMLSSARAQDGRTGQHVMPHEEREPVPSFLERLEPVHTPPYDIVIVGHTRGGAGQASWELQRLSRLLQEHASSAAAVVLAGDIGFEGTRFWWEQFDQLIRERLAVPVHVAVGNHDLPSGTRWWYEHRYGSTIKMQRIRDTVLLQLDTERAAGTLDEQQLLWAEASLRAAAADPKVEAILVVLHRVLWMADPRFGPEAAVQLTNRTSHPGGAIGLLPDQAAEAWARLRAALVQTRRHKPVLAVAGDMGSVVPLLYDSVGGVELIAVGMAPQPSAAEQSPLLRLSIGDGKVAVQTISTGGQDLGPIQQYTRSYWTSRSDRAGAE